MILRTLMRRFNLHTHTAHPHSHTYTCSRNMCEVFTANFQSALDLELSQKALAMEFRGLLTAVGSPYAFTRLTALKKVLQLLLEQASLNATSSDGSCYDVVGRLYRTHASGIKRSAPTSSSPRSAASGAAAVDSALDAQWERLQLTLKGNLVSQVFLRVFPRRDLLFQVGPVQPVAMSHEDALRWSTVAVVPSPSHGGSGSSGSGTVPFFDRLAAVTLPEQEVALRFLQGVSIVLPHQKEYLLESPLMPLFAETMQLLKQHIDALAHEAQREQLLVGAQPTPSATTRVVHIDRGLEAVITAMIDTVEALCHYHSRSIVSFVSTGALRAALQVLVTPYAPVDIRCALMDMVSLLLQEIAPFRGMLLSVSSPVSRPLQEGASSSSSSPTAAAASPTTVAPPLDTLSAMLDVARGGYGQDSSSRTGPLLAIDRASASKFESCVRDFFAQRRCLHVVPMLQRFRDVGEGTGVGVATPKPELHRLLHRAYRQRESTIAELLRAMDSHAAEMDAASSGGAGANTA